MKKIGRKLSAILMAIALVGVMLLSTSAETQAATTTLNKRVLTLYSAKSQSYNSILGKYISANMTNIAAGPSNYNFQNLKSSDTKKATITLKNGTGVNKGVYAVVASLKKTGNVTLSYKSKNETYKQTFIVKKYVNPLKTLTIDGKNIATKFAKDNVYVLPYAKYAGKKVKVSYAAVTNYDIVSASYLVKQGDTKADMVKNNASVKIQKKNSALIFDAYNEKTQQLENCMVIFK